MTWHTDSKDLKQLITKLNKFGMAQQVLSRALLEAKPLGICRTCTYGQTEYGLENRVLTSKSGIITTISKGNFGHENSREML